MMNLLAPVGFQCLQPDLPVTMYRRNLPHWRQEGATYFVTFRLADSLPQSKLRELKSFREEWFRQHPSPIKQSDWDDYSRKMFARVEKWLDQNMGECHLRKAKVRNILIASLHYFDHQRYELGCYVVMPNHVHIVIRPLNPAAYSLEKMLESIKKWTSRESNNALNRCGSFWQDESFDRIIRNEEHLFKVVQYIGNNPMKASLASGDFVRWISPNWITAGWKFDWL